MEIDRLSQLREDWRLARTAHMDMQLMRLPRVNLLLRGSETVVENVIDMLRPTLHAPLGCWRSGERLVLPPPSQAGTMILRNVGALSTDDQQRLLKWLDLSAGRTQVVSTVMSSLLSRIESGAFLDTLYYRLNTVCVNLSVSTFG
jgi:sigma-54-interacting transcriptional regulator